MQNRWARSQSCAPPECAASFPAIAVLAAGFAMFGNTVTGNVLQSLSR